IYAPLADDAVTESKAAAMGGVTTMLTYFRTGQYYLNRGGSWRDFFPDVLKLSQDRYWCDYAYHLAPIQSLHLEEMEMLAVEHGARCAARGGGDLPRRRLPARGHRRPPSARLRRAGRRPRQGHSSAPAARGRRVPLAGRARRPRRLDRERPCMLRERGQGR